MHAVALVTSALVLSLCSVACGRSAEPSHMPRELVQHNGEEFGGVIPILRTADIERSLAYYEDKLHFKTLWRWGDPVDFAAAGRGHVTVFFCHECQGNSGTWLMLFVKDVDALYEEYKQTGARIAQPPRNEPWGMREMHVVDPDGHVLRLGTGLDH